MREEVRSISDFSFKLAVMLEGWFRFASFVESEVPRIPPARPLGMTDGRESDRCRLGDM